MIVEIQLFLVLLLKAFARAHTILDTFGITSRSPIDNNVIVRFTLILVHTRSLIVVTDDAPYPLHNMRGKVVEHIEYCSTITIGQIQVDSFFQQNLYHLLLAAERCDMQCTAIWCCDIDIAASCDEQLNDVVMAILTREMECCVIDWCRCCFDGQEEIAVSSYEHLNDLKST